MFWVLAVAPFLILLFLLYIRNKPIDLVAPAHPPMELQQLFTKLKKDNFVIEQIDNPGILSFNNCNAKENYDFSGTGVQRYYIHSPIAIRDNIYPDFRLSVLNFKSPDVARNYANQILVASKQMWSDGECVHNKIPWKLVRVENNVYLLTTKAEVLRTYIEHYGDLLQNSKQLSQ